MSQDSPWFPHAEFNEPGWQVSDAGSQQPKGHVRWLHDAPMHWGGPPEHCSPNCVQSWHVELEPPHSVSTSPGRQTPNALQHPLSQLDKLHAEHCWPTHCAPMPTQFWQALPRFPQAGAVKPGWQLPVVSQQPVGQLAGLHTGGVSGWQLPPPPAFATQLAGAPRVEQSAHWPPIRPHEVGTVPSSHTWPAQHPLQLVGPQGGGGGGGTHCCAVQTSPVLAQERHACPPEPHTFGSFPVKHTLPVQHPLQLAALHCPTFVSHACTTGSHDSKPVATQSRHAWPNVPHALEPPPG